MVFRATGLRLRLLLFAGLALFLVMGSVNPAPICADSSCAPVPGLDCLIGGQHFPDKCDIDDLICAAAFCKLNPEVCSPAVE